MEGFIYEDIFATKGIEYLLVIGYLLVLVVFWKFLNRRSAAGGRASVRAMPVLDWFQLKDGFYFHQGHTWAVPEGGGVVRVGMDDFAQKLLGEPVSVELPDIGSSMEQGSKGWRLVIDSKSVEMLSPVNGEVLEVNEEVLRSPESVCGDPYGKGWLMKVKVSRMKSDLKNLLSGRLAAAWMEETVDRLRRTTAGDLGLVLQDGGVPVAGFARNLSPDKWHEIAVEFLLSK